MEENVDSIKGRDENDRLALTVHRRAPPPDLLARLPSLLKGGPHILLCSRPHWPAFLPLW